MSEVSTPLRLNGVLAYLEDSDQKLLHELHLCRDILNLPMPHRWTVAQIVEHLIRAEAMMIVIWKFVPTLGRWPNLLKGLDSANHSLWRSMGMQIVEPVAERITPANAVAGKFRAPAFLSPPSRQTTYEKLIAKRAKVRQRTLRAVKRIPEQTLERLSWSLPHSGSYTLLELVQFIGIHEAHHLPQMQRIRECA
jgi:hypothetical protein